jgi:hypothetical protein
VKFPQELMPLKFKCNVMLIFNLYAKKAQSFNKETEEELSRILSYDIYIQSVFMSDKKDKFYRPTHEMPAGVTLTVDLVKQNNTYFELNKPAGIVTTTVFFIGLISHLTALQIKLQTSTIKAWLRFIMAKLTILQNILTLCPVWQEKYLMLIIISFLLR